MAQCKGIKSNCYKCGWKQDRKKIEKCLQCGEDMHCKRGAVPGYGYCEFHGGPNPKHNFYGRGRMTDGSASQFPIARLAAKYNQVRNDGRLLSNRAAVEIIDARIMQLAERIDVDDAPDRLGQLYNLWEQYTEALDDGKSVEAVLKRKSLDKMFEKAHTDSEAWNQMMIALDLRRKMSESEVKVLRELKAIMTVEDGYELAAKFAAAMVKIVNEPKQMKRIYYEITRIIGESGFRSGEAFSPDDLGSGGEEGSAGGPGEVDQEGILDSRDQG